MDQYVVPLKVVGHVQVTGLDFPVRLIDLGVALGELGQGVGSAPPPDVVEQAVR
ncbi:hypothetical protein ACFYOK_12205 [Microbispora bryophytorum]|uniref:hypothetical protein n=1 Tax=Microbispora bryophytorum TaxID=1460882 RepID=UPI003407B44B